jgi:alginate O-acetyltransferase complex protein AlgI
MAAVARAAAELPGDAMLFNSYVFLLAYLPVTLAGFFVCGRRSEALGAAWLAAASLFFYGWWDYRYLPLLLASVGFNYWCGQRLRSAAGAGKRLLCGAIAVNLGLLAYYKYAAFFVASVGALSGDALPALDIVLPIGISFFTFTQIAFLVDTYKGAAKEGRFVHYLLFVTYFPHLIAGPILHHKEMMPQFADRRIYTVAARNVAIGTTIFVIGLAKKVLVADNIGPYSASLFSHPAAPSLLLAWGGVLAYAFQLYFDFSGYSDMAIGLSRLFGVRLPLNFDSPYKACNIAEFWRRWHMTLSRFLRDYLYIPLGGNRHGSMRRQLNLVTTMVLGGLWHGAGWNFMVWGALHGMYLVAHQAWVKLACMLRLPAGVPGARLASTALTFVAVCVAWVFFRAPDMATAMAIVRGMAGGYGVALPQSLAQQLLPARPVFEALGVTTYLGGGAVFIETWSWVLLAGALAFGFPNTQQITRRYVPALDRARVRAAMAPRLARALAWRPTRGWAMAIAVLALTSFLSLNRPAEFLYFQF